VDTIASSRPVKRALRRDRAPRRPLVTVVLPVYNEAAILRRNLETLLAYLETLEHRFRFEILIVNDGSADGTGGVASELADLDARITAVHHVTNFGLGQAFQTAFRMSRGDYVVTLDIDLSYAPEHVGVMLDEIMRSRAKLVLASPYAPGGKVSNVPWLRRTLSVWANRFLSLVSYGRISTFTCMTRAYDGPFLRSLNLRGMSMDVMPETVYKAMALGGRIAQVPAHLDWSLQNGDGPARRSSMRVLRHIVGTTLSGFVFRPFLFFIVPGLALLAFAGYTTFWMLVHYFTALAQLAPEAESYLLTSAFATAYAGSPHTFTIGLLSMVLSIQLLGLGFITLQSKRYFEELFHLGTTVRRELSGFYGPAAGDRS
jgi:glycosyltransferase involved in cell wall biosynthesis